MKKTTSLSSRPSMNSSNLGPHAIVRRERRPRKMDAVASSDFWRARRGDQTGTQTTGEQGRQIHVP